MEVFQKSEMLTIVMGAGVYLAAINDGIHHGLVGNEGNPLQRRVNDLAPRVDRD